MNITFRQRLCNRPGSVNHQRKVQIEASTSSTYMPAAPMAARCHLLGSIHESETLQYRQGVSTRIIMPISWHSPPKCLQVSPWPNSCRTLVTPSTTASQKALWMLKNWWNVGQLRAEHVELDRHQRQRRERQQQHSTTRRPARRTSAT